MKYLKAVLNFAPTLLRALAAALGSFVTSVFTINVLDEMDLLGSPSERDFAIIFLFVSLFLVCLMVLFRQPERFDEEKISYEAFCQIEQARRSRIASAALLLIFGISAVVFAARTVDYATGDIQSFGISTSLQSAYDSNARSISMLSEEIASKVLTMTESEVADFDQRMDRLLATQNTLGGELRSEKGASSLVNADGTVKQIFLFQYFSSLLVRLGTLGIVLVLFGVVLRQYRRYEKQILEIRQISLAIKLTKLDLKSEHLTALRHAVGIDDEAKSTDKNELDTVFASSYTSYLSSIADNLKKNLS